VILDYGSMAVRLDDRGAIPSLSTCPANVSGERRLLHKLWVTLVDEVDAIEHHFKRHQRRVAIRKQRRRQGWWPGR